MSGASGKRPEGAEPTTAGAGTGEERADDSAVAFAQTVAGDSAAEAGGDGERAHPCQLGRYQILEVLGRGGMGVVYAAHDPDLDRRVAVKVLRTGGPGGSEGGRARLLREARAMARLNHPNVITVHEVGSEGDIDFVAMELIEGETLASWMSRSGRPWRQVVRMFLGAGQGLVAAHDAGLIHRDFKPDNVLVDAGGRAVVTDFGLARPPRADPAAVSLERTAAPGEIQGSGLETVTAVGSIAGTPAYMAAEQHAGEDADERSDQFAFCVALYEALYGKRPFSGDTLEALRRRVQAGDIAIPVARQGVPLRLRRAVLRGLAPERAERHPSMRALLRELGRALKRRRRHVMALSAAAIMGAGTFGVFAGGELRGPSLCDASQHLAGVWDADTRVALTSSLERDPSAALAIETLDGYASEWRESFESTCSAAHERSEIAEEDFLLARACLMDRRHDLRALVAALGDEGAGQKERAASAAQALPPLGDCEDFESLRAGIAPPEADVAETVDALRRELAALRALQEAGHPKQADERLDELVEAARQTEYAPLLAEAVHRKGEIKAALSQVSAAREALEEAVFLAEVEDYDELQARALVATLDMEARFSSDFEATSRIAERARAAVRRYGRDRRLEARFHGALARMYTELGRFEEAEEALEEALARYRQEDGQKSVRAALILNDLAQLSERRGRTDDAIELSRQALDEAAASMGSDHPRVTEIALDHARRLQQLGRYDEARQLYEDVEARRANAKKGDTSAESESSHSPAEGGRAVEGRVVDARGEPVAGAEVVVGGSILADGRYAYGYRGEWAERFDNRRTFSDDDGRFAFDGVPTSALSVVAEHDQRGRSLPARVPELKAEGEDADADIVLALEPFGSLEGEVRVEGDDSASVFVVALPETGEAADVQSVVYAQPDGSFHFERLAAGPYTLFAMATLGSGSMEYVWEGEGSAALYQEVRAGETERISFRMASPGKSLRARVVDGEGAHVPWAHVQLYTDTGGARSEDSAGRAREATASPGKPATLTNVAPGVHTLCADVSPVDRRNPEADAALREAAVDLPRTCDAITVSPSRAPAADAAEPQTATLVIDALPSLRELQAAQAEAEAPEKVDGSDAAASIDH